MPNALRDGEQAARGGLLESDNPYTEGTYEFNDWLEGFDGYEPMIKNSGRHEWR